MADFSLIAARALSYATLLLVAGLPLYLLTGGRDLALTTRLRWVMAAIALFGALASTWLALASVAAMAAMDLAALDRELVGAVLAATPLGFTLNVRLGALALLVVALFVVPARARLPLAALLGGIALAAGVLTGHAGATTGTAGTVHRLADAVHLLAAATWLGGLAMLLGGLFAPGRQGSITTHLAGFARTGTVIVVLLGITGIVNSLIITGWPVPDTVFTSTWTVLLVAKLALFAIMLGLAAINRWYLTPALERDGGAAALSRLRLSLGAEATAGTAIILLVSLLGLLDPAA